MDSPLLTPAGQFTVANLTKTIRFSFNLPILSFYFPCPADFDSESLLLVLPSQALATMTSSIHRLLFLSSLYTSSLAAAAAYNATNSTFDVFKYVDQLIGTNNYGNVYQSHSGTSMQAFTTTNAS